MPSIAPKTRRSEGTSSTYSRSMAREGGREHAVLLLHLVLLREGRAAEQSAGNRRYEDGENCHGHEPGRTHMIES